MTGFETVLLRVAGTAAGAVVKSFLTRTPGAGLAPDPVRPGRRWLTPPAELRDPEVRRLTETLAGRLGAASAALPEHERLAAVDAVGDAFAALGALDMDTLLDLDLSPGALADHVLAHTPPAGLSDAAQALYRELVAQSCAHAVEHMTSLPAFAPRAGVELLRRSGALARAVHELGEARDGAAHAFEERYARYIAGAHGRLQLFGITLSRSPQEWPLDVAYIGLTVSGEQLLPGNPASHRTVRRADEALASAERTLLRGPAGSGKSTLVQWLAVNAARRSFTGGLAPWNTCVPFVLRLRSFTTTERLPLPAEFLPESGVPLTAPAGWAEDLMREGRALVLVDGVDEVPLRLRGRTQVWLRGLISAFPKARYVVTTRPSAVPEDWLAGQAFTAHSLLPMEREDIGSFIGHWHAAARAECADDAQRADVDAYEASLREAVGTRRDLGKLAANPLMCALLCALNRDRRMQLPRARKELYDAALEMLLVRRDAEREITGVEGVRLTRDEQTLLLQRLAYWLIRNGQTEADCDEAVELVEEWLDSMVQVRAQGTAAEVFSHLLIRSGLLREPVPGTVHFVHRTFQDYLGAKAAVEARDLGVLVRNAHDDTWDDVVRMAVGHARPDERATLLRRILGRADKVRKYRGRLVLLAAACLEHAPELDPAVRHEVERRTAELLPPRNAAQAEELAKAGPLVLELLTEPLFLEEDAAAATVRTATLIGGDQAVDLLARFRPDDRFKVRWELADGWDRFEQVQEYADAVLARTRLDDVQLWVRTPAQLAALPRLDGLRRIALTGGRGLPPEVRALRDLEHLALLQSPLTDLSGLTVFEGLKYLGLYDCQRIAFLDPLTALPSLESLTLVGAPDRLGLAPLARMEALAYLFLNYPVPGTDRVSDLPAPAGLKHLHLHARAAHLALDDIGRWPELTWLTFHGPERTADFLALPDPSGLKGLQILDAEVGSEVLLRCPGLEMLALSDCTLPQGLSALRELPELTRLTLLNAGEYDLAPLARLPGLTVVVGANVRLHGADSLPPERIRRLS
ncbi:NACHT domain-containing protein [Streptomyces sp. NPDC048507]|uniref:NACHT domain-containing protein n=1 Tax=Streptomyces sp. NPDC048507 TaxID=3365560 RepID=UPI003711ACF7